MTTKVGAMVPLSGTDIEIVRTVRERITRVDLTNYPILSSIAKSSVAMRDSTKIEWLTDDLEDITYTSAPYGATATITARGKPDGRHTHMETFFNAFSLSEESIAAGYYGINSRWAYENNRHIAEMSIAIEKQILNANTSGVAAAASNSNTATTPMLETLITTNAQIGGGSATKPAFSSSSNEFTARVRSATDGDRKSISLADIENLAVDIYKQQDTPRPASQMLMSVDFKQYVDSLAGDYTLGDYRQQIGGQQRPDIQTSIRNMHLLNDQSLAFVPVKHMTGNNNIFLVDLMGIMILYYYWNRTKPLGATGISRELLRWFTWTLIYQTEAGAGSLLDRKAA